MKSKLDRKQKCGSFVSYRFNFIKKKERNEMKFSNLSLEKLVGASERARHKIRSDRNLEQHFETPIIHREIQGDRVYVPLNLYRVWNEA